MSLYAHKLGTNRRLGPRWWLSWRCRLRTYCSGSFSMTCSIGCKLLEWCWLLEAVLWPCGTSCKRSGTLLVVAVRLRMWGFDFLVTKHHKCVHLPPPILAPARGMAWHISSATFKNSSSYTPTTSTYPACFLTSKDLAVISQATSL